MSGSNKLTRKAIEKLRKAARRAALERLKNPQTGVKPADPRPAGQSAPGSGVDEWRNEGK